MGKGVAAVVAIDHKLALWAGYASLAVLAAAAGYYPLHLLRERLLRADSPSAGVGRLKTAVTLARATHPYLASLVSMAAGYHVYVMLLTRPVGPKVASGLLVSAGIVLMANSGWIIKFRPSAGRVRRVHRAGAVILAALAVLHIFL